MLCLLDFKQPARRDYLMHLNVYTSMCANPYLDVCPFFCIFSIIHYYLHITVRIGNVYSIEKKNHIRWFI